MSEINDLTQIGLSLKAREQLKQLEEDGHFSEMKVGYRFAIALALSRGMVPPEIQAPRQTMYSTPTIDPDGAMAAAILALMPGEDVPPYRWAERLAEAGIEILVAGSDAGSLDLVGLVVRAQDYDLESAKTR